jgi:non-heme chloroperoxidase
VEFRGNVVRKPDGALVESEYKKEYSATLDAQDGPMPFAQTQDGLRICYETHGSGQLPLLLLHGWGGSASYWRELVQHLDTGRLRVIAPTYRGHGDSDKPTTGYDLDHLASDVFAVADCAGAPRFVLVGFSMSGKFAQYIAALQPERVLGLVLVAPVPASEFPVPPEVARAWCDSQRDRTAAFEQILAPFTRIPVRLELTELFLDDFAKAARIALEQTLNMCAVSCVEQARSIHVPTLVVSGSHDPLLTPQSIRSTILTHIPAARMIELPCGHEIPQEMPEQAAALLEAFLSGLGQVEIETTAA